MKKVYLYSMLKFDSKGHLKPYEPIVCDVKDLKIHFVDAFTSVTRSINYTKYVKYSDDLKALLGGVEITQWINGSFVTKKINPKDIDFINFIDHDLIQKFGEKLHPFRPENSWDIYGVDAYILEVYPSDSKDFVKFTQSDRAYWYSQFDKTRRNRNGIRHPKGFLEIIY